MSKRILTIDMRMEYRSAEAVSDSRTWSFGAKGLAFFLTTAFLIAPLLEVYADESEEAVPGSTSTEEPAGESDGETVEGGTAEIPKAEEFVETKTEAEDTAGDDEVSETKTFIGESIEAEILVPEEVITGTSTKEELGEDNADIAPSTHTQTDSATSTEVLGETATSTEREVPAESSSGDDAEEIGTTTPEAILAPESIEKASTSSANAIPKSRAPILSEEVVEVSDTIVTEEVASTSATSTIGFTATSTNASNEDQATTTTEEVVHEVSVVTNDENRYQFSVDECVPVGDGSFYCSEIVDGTEEVADDRVFVSPDNDGDQEIFVTLQGKTTQLTFNTYDDLAPSYDPVSNRIVWHALIDDRYQIMSLDLRSGEERKLTATTYNNMEPVAYGDLTLWQAWVDTDWEIMLEEQGEVVQLTENDVPDIAPYVRGEYIMWQSQTADGWNAVLYDRSTGVTEVVGESNGGVVENPRFVLVYDSKKENGDVEIVGYDLKTKETIHLASEPTPVPNEIPEPDTTGEERALVQTKPTLREIEEKQNNEPADDPDMTNGTAASSTTNASESSVTLPEVIATSTEETIVPDEDPSTAIASTTPESAAASPSIPDIVVPEFTSESETQ